MSYFRQKGANNVVKENYLINEAAKEVHVESHVLRYWEEELNLPIKRNPQGHRVYTREDIDRLIHIKKLKDQGLQLKAVKLVLNQIQSQEEEHEDMKTDNPFAQKQLTKISKNGDMKVIQLKPYEEEKWKGRHMIEVKEKKFNVDEKQEIAIKMKDEMENQCAQEEKVARMQYLLQKMIKNTVESNNDTLINKISENIKQDICKELDYQFRLVQEQEEERMQAQEAHYKRIDELLRERTEKAAKQQKEPSKIFRFLHTNQ